MIREWERKLSSIHLSGAGMETKSVHPCFATLTHAKARHMVTNHVVLHLAVMSLHHAKGTGPLPLHARSLLGNVPLSQVKALNVWCTNKDTPRWVPLLVTNRQCALFGLRPQRGTKSCRTQGESVRPSTRPSIRSLLSPSSSPWPKALQKLAQDGWTDGRIGSP